MPALRVYGARRAGGEQARVVVPQYLSCHRTHARANAAQVQAMLDALLAERPREHASRTQLAPHQVLRLRRDAFWPRDKRSASMA